MKTNILLRAMLFQATLITACFIAVSCNNNNTAPQPDNSTEVAKKENDAKFNEKKQEKDAQFLVDATLLNLEEIQLAQLAAGKSSNADVKTLAKMMLADHTKTLKEVTDLAKKKQVTVPDSATTGAQTPNEDLNSKSGNDFDKAYCSKMVDAHKDAIAKFEKEVADSRDGEIKDWATVKLPDLRKHLDHVFACQKKVEKK